ncbi:caspase family protein [Novosphingobium album (ex Liu et al. 2023)]|uniref:caspase family protein n=1 Tax=Novosphingobium album (ex Liu et al. 2023) TaxID=3031130 RepID=UPI0023AED62D|nr:caspase family protein [Novosphingobium album (ex Liu et al. 2023)]
MADGNWYCGMLLILCVLVFTVGLSSPAQARRVALIIGNSTYSHANMLPNSASDASLIAEAARGAGFETVLLSDLTKDNFGQALRDFRRQADGAEVAMIYYAGHGMESGGRNWVIPVDAVLQDSLDLRFEAVDLDGLLETVSGAALRIVVLDACRNNPFGKTWRSAVRTVPAGLAEMEMQGSGSLLMFAAAGGQVATDGTGGNSPFARALARYLPEPGLSIHRLGLTVREEVIKETGGSQSPWVSMTLEGKEFFLVPPPAAATTVASADSGGNQALADAYAWRYADAKNSVAAYEEYIGKFPGGVFVNDARQRITQLSAAKPAVPAPKPAPPAVKDIVKEAPVKVAASSPSGAAPQPGAMAPGVVPSADTQTMAMITQNANITTDRGILPKIPPAPRFPAEGYPNCREDHAAILDPIAKVVKINECLAALTWYVSDVMNGFSARMIKHQEELTRLYSEEVGGKPVHSPQSQKRFFDETMAEFRESNPTGSHFAEYRAAKERYERDREYLQAQYCLYTAKCAN